jgi:uncharacterized protein
MRTICLEEPFATPGFLDGPGCELKDQASRYNSSRAVKLIEQLCDIGAGRIAEMDGAGIDMQVLSLTSPGTEQLEAADAVFLAGQTNDYLAESIRKNPARFSGFASLPTAAPDKAAQELERRVTEQKFAGAVINGHNRGRYLDDKFYWPILECAEKLGVPIYLHPTPPPPPVIETSYGGFAPLVTQMLAGPGWGWHIETAVPRDSPCPRRCLRPVPEFADRDWPYGRRAAIHVPAIRCHSASGDEARTADCRLFARKPSLYVQRFQFSARLPRSTA